MRKLFVFYLVIFSSLILGIVYPISDQAQLDHRDTRLNKEPSQTNEVSPMNSVQKIIEQVDKERVLMDLRRLTGEEPICTKKGCYTITNRETESEGLQWAKDYVLEILVNLNYSVEMHDWSFEGYKDQNIIARKQGMVYPNEEIYFIAHLDGYLSNNPAANDDASGVVSLLEMARILSGQSLRHTVVIFFSTWEEHGSLGSRSFVDHLTKEQLNFIKYIVSVEMLGYDSENDGKMEFWSGNQQDNFINLLAEIIKTYQIALTPEVFTDCY